MAIAKLSGKKMAMAPTHVADITWFNANMRASDVFIFNNIGTAFTVLRPQVSQGLFCALYTDITVAQFGGGTKSIGGASGPTGFTYVGYDCEAGNTPVAQLDALPTYVQNCQTLAHAYGVQNFVVLDLKNAQRWVTGISPYCDNIYIQVQRYAQDIQRSLNFVSNFAWQVRSVNPACQVWVQLQTDQYPLEYQIKQVWDVADYIDGISLSDNGNPQVGAQTFANTVRI